MKNSGGEDPTIRQPASCFSWLPSTIQCLDNLGFQMQVKLGSDCVRRRKLYKAVQSNNLQQAEEILSQGLSLHKHTILLDMASVRGYKELFGLLIRYYDVHHPLIRTRALDIAVWQCDIEITKTLLEAGIDYRSRNCYGETILYVAARGNSARLVDLFVDLGCDVNAKTRGMAPVHVAIQRGHVETQKALIRNGCDVNLVEDRNGHSPLVLAILAGRFSCIHNLIKAGCKVDFPFLVTISSVQQQFQKHPKWEAVLKQEYLRVKPLTELCRRRVRKSLGPRIIKKVKVLGIPAMLQDFVSLAKELDLSHFEQLHHKRTKRKRPLGGATTR